MHALLQQMMPRPTGNAWNRIYRDYLGIADTATLRWRGYTMGTIQRREPDGHYLVGIQYAPNGIFGIYVAAEMPGADARLVGYALVFAHVIIELFNANMIPFDVARANHLPNFTFYVDWE
jgi:hypothetical protein